MYRISNKHRIPSLLYILLLVSTPANIIYILRQLRSAHFSHPVMFRDLYNYTNNEDNEVFMV